MADLLQSLPPKTQLAVIRTAIDNLQHVLGGNPQVRMEILAEQAEKIIAGNPDLIAITETAEKEKHGQDSAPTPFDRLTHEEQAALTLAAIRFAQELPVIEQYTPTQKAHFLDTKIRERLETPGALELAVSTYCTQQSGSEPADAMLVAPQPRTSSGTKQGTPGR